MDVRAGGPAVWVDAVDADGVGDGEMDAIAVVEIPPMTPTGDDEDALLDDRTGGSGADLEDLGRVCVLW